MPEKKKIGAHVDFSSARLLEPLPIPGPYLFACSAFQMGTSGSGGKKVHAELTCVEPKEFAGRKVFDDLSTENEYTLGRLMTLLIGLGENKEEILSETYELPEEKDMIGRQCAVWLGIRPSDVYGDRNTIRRVRPAAAYTTVKEASY